MFRNYENADQRVRQHYHDCYQNQCKNYVNRMKQIYCSEFTIPLTIWDALSKLDDFRDYSDPDLDLPNSIHAYQTAKALRRDRLPEWMQVVGLIHDLGKMMYSKRLSIVDGVSPSHQFGVVGDTFLLDEPLPPSAVYPEYHYLHQYSHPPPQQKQGLKNALISFGHDEYLYQVLLHNHCLLPDEALAVIRFHSLQVWHRHDAYIDREDDEDRTNKKWVQLFSKYDLYTKDNKDVKPLSIEERNYFQNLLEKYAIGGIIFF